MNKKQEISGAEFEVMQVLWDGERPMKVQDVCDCFQNDKWKYKTVATLLLRLEEKGAVRSKKEGKANVYSALLDKDEYTKIQTKSFVNRLYNGSVKELAVSLFKNEGMSKEDVEEIKRMFNL